MSSTEALETPREKRSLSSRLRAHARKAAIPVMLLGITVSGVGVSASAHAASAPSCSSLPSQTCPAAPAPLPARGSQPAGISNQDWRGAQTAATFWSNEGVSTSNPSRLAARGESGFPGNGWPGSSNPNARGWYAYDTGTSRVQEHWEVYYGGVFQDRQGDVARLELRHHVSQNNASGSNNVYREYDVNSWQRVGNHHPRDAQRLVRNTRNGHVYATFDHYGSFHYLGTW